MKKAIKLPLESGFGFRSPGFSVDSEGNLTATSFNITQEGAPAGAGVFDFTVSDDQANFFIDGLAGANPAITLARGKTYTFRLELVGFAFFIKRADGITNQINGLAHSSDDTGVDAQGKTDGILSFSVPLNADSTLFYTDAQGVATGPITVVDPEGLFSSVSITSDAQSTSADSGALVVAGGVGVAGDLFIGGELNFAGVGIPRISSNTNLELNAVNKIVLQVNSIKVGEIDLTGLSTTINKSIITASSIDNSVIGGTIPAAAAFTNATVQNNPVTNNDITKKSYVDLTSIAFSIALGS